MARHQAEHRKNPKLGYLLYLGAATLWAINGTVSKVVLQEVGDPLRVSQFRGTATALVLILWVLATNRKAFRITAKEALMLAAYGIVGVAMCQWFYFESISRIPITVSLLIEFMAPIFVVLFVRFVWHQPVRSTVWAGLALSIAGLALVQEVWNGVTLNKLGLLFAIGSMSCLIVMYLIGDRASARRDPISLLMWAFTFSAIFFATLRSWGGFPFESLTAHVTPFEGSAYSYPIWPFFTYMVLFGTVAPYILVINSIRHIGGAGASIMGITEPPIAAIVAWFVLGEALSIVQILGGFVILAGVYIAENAREHSADPQPVDVEVETTSQLG